MSNDASLIDYYAKRANEYERIYEKPERQNDLAKLKELFQKTCAGHYILEIACGTGYWTQAISQTAKSITATDFNEEVLQIARAKKYGCEVSFQKADAFNVSFPQNNFTAGLAAAWWSHLKNSEIRNFLSKFQRQFCSGSLMVFMDNRFVPGSNTPISRTDTLTKCGNSKTEMNMRFLKISLMKKKLEKLLAIRQSKFAGQNYSITGF